MPGKNTIKSYIQGGFYHLYNRGVEKRIIFKEKSDYKVFLGYLKKCLLPPPTRAELIKTFTLQGETFKGIPRLPKNFHEEIELLAYCLMPNHFHFLVKQTEEHSIENFMGSLLTRYSMYFNKKYVRVGSLFQGPYKAALIIKDAYLLHLSRYIHLNPVEIASNLVNTYSSYGEYLGLRKTKWIKPDFILSFFQEKSRSPALNLGKKSNSYREFVEEYKGDSKDILENLTIEE